MDGLILLLIFSLTPAERAAVADLGAPKFAAREAAEKRLRPRVDARLALLLDSAPVPNREAERRLAGILRDWREQRARELVLELIPNWQDAPYIDGLNGPGCLGEWKPGIRQFYQQASYSKYPPHVPWAAFRYATVLYVSHLAHERRPVKEIRSALDEMRRQSAEWDRTHKWGHGAEQVPMPRPF